MRRSALAFAVALTACFSDAPPVGACSIGSSGCACTSGGACDPGLDCHVPSQLCFDPECTLGAADCPCSAGECVGTLVCTDDYCQSPPTGTTGASADDPSVADASMDASSTSPTASADATGMTMASDPTNTTDDPATSSVDASASSASAGDTVATDDGATASSVTAGGDLCRECMLDTSSGGCMPLYQDCLVDAECEEIFVCVFENKSEPIDCCAAAVGGHGAYDTFVGCARAACVECDEMLWTCGGG